MGELLWELGKWGLRVLSNLSLPVLIIGPWGVSQMFKNSSSMFRLGVGLVAFAVGAAALISLRWITGFPYWLDRFGM